MPLTRAALHSQRTCSSYNGFFFPSANIADHSLKAEPNRVKVGWNDMTLSLGDCFVRPLILPQEN